MEVDECYWLHWCCCPQFPHSSVTCRLCNTLHPQAFKNYLSHQLLLEILFVIKQDVWVMLNVHTGCEETFPTYFVGASRMSWGLCYNPFEYNLYWQKTQCSPSHRAFPYSVQTNHTKHSSCFRTRIWPTAFTTNRKNLANAALSILMEPKRWGVKAL